MKRNLIVIIALVLIMTHVIPPYNIILANDEVNDCENMDFTVQTILENDKKIVGNGMPSDQLTFEFKTKNKTEVVNVNSNGKFELTVEEEFLAANDVVTISNEYYKIETKVAPKESTSSTLTSEKYNECKIIEETEEVVETTNEDSSETGETETEKTNEDSAEIGESEQEPTDKNSLKERKETEQENEEEISGDELARWEKILTEHENEVSRLIEEYESQIFNIKENNETSNIAPFASLTEVQLLTDVVISADLNNPTEGQPYNLNLNLNGNGLADVELLNLDRTVVFHAPDLAGELAHSGGMASVQVDILPINLQEDLPTLYNAIDPLTNTLNELVGTLSIAIDGILNNPLTGWLLNVQGLTELTDSLAALNNLDDALQDLTSYTDQVEYVINEDGTVVVSFTDGLGNHLNTAVQDVVVNALNRVGDAIGALEVGGVAGSVLAPVVTPTIGLLETLVVETLNPLVENILNGTVNSTENLASAQVIGNTNVNLDVLVNNPTGDVSGKIPVFGAGIQDSVIDITLLDSLQSQTTVTFPEPPRFVLTQPENIIFNTTEINSGEEKIYRQDNEYNIEVTDERPNSNWTLSIQALEPLKTLDEIHSLPDALFYFEDGNEPKSIENEPVEIAQKDQNDTSDTQNIVWDREEGLLLKTDPIEAVAGEEYSTTIEWTLTDGP